MRTSLREWGGPTGAFPTTSGHRDRPTDPVLAAEAEDVGRAMKPPATASSSRSTRSTLGEPSTFNGALG